MTRSTLLSGLLLALLPSVALTQEFRATIVGRVTDSTGAAIAGAKVSATNIETNATSSSNSGDTGDYTLPALSPGIYQLKVERDGFKTYVQSGITLQIQDRPAIDVQLEVGEISSSVTVSADASQLETATASRGAVITGRTLVDLPLNGRNAFALAALTPGVNFTGRGQSTTFLRTTANGGISGASISGGQPRGNEALLDGVPNTGSDGVIQFVPSVDATQEFKVQTNVFDAEFGRFTGGLINASTKPGTNSFHGSLFEFVRNSAFNARDPFATEIPQFGYNLFGGSVGGPVYLPKIYNGKDRTFFFFNYEGSREGVPRAFVSTVPTPLQLQGDFSQTQVRLANGQASPITVYDPSTTRQSGSTWVRDVFPGNVIPASRMDPVARNILSLFPAPNAPGDAITGANNYLYSFKDPVLDNGYVVRIDHRFSDRHQIFGRYSWRHFYVGRQGAFKNVVTGDHEDRNAPGFAFDDTFTLNPTTVLNFRYGFSRFVSQANADSLGYDLTELGFPASFAASAPVSALPRIDISGYTTLANPTKLSRNAEDSHTWRGGVTKIISQHSIRFGGEARLLRSYQGSSGNSASGTFSFNTVFTRGPNPQANSVTAGSSLASFLLGLPASGSVANNARTAEQAPYYGFYFQDDIRVSQRLTVNVGLRYEWEGANTERFNGFNRGYAFDTASPLEAQAQAAYAASPIPEVPVSAFNVKGGLLFAGVNGQPRGITNQDRNNVAPRIGVAYSLTPRTVLRGGYGIFYGATTLLSETRQGFSVTTPFVGTIDGGLTPVNTLSSPYPQGLLAAAGSADGLLTLVGQGINFVDVNRKQPYAHQFQFGIQQEMPAGVLIDAAYVGSLGRDLAVSRDLNAIPATWRDQARQTYLETGRNILNDSVPNPFYGLISSGSLSSRTTTRGQLLRAYPQFTSVTILNQSIGQSRYDAFQLKVTKRFSQGLSLLASYAAAKQLDQTSYLNDEDATLVKELNDYDIPQRLTFSAAYELPFGRGKALFGNAKGIVGKAAEGWQLNVIYTAQGGVPLAISGAESLGSSAEIDGSTVDRWFDTSVFRQRQTLERVGLSVLPDVRSAGKNNFDLSVFKTTSISERVRLQFRVEAFNALNRPEYSSPNTSFGASNFGRVTSTNTFARQLQFGLKLLW